MIIRCAKPALNLEPFNGQGQPRRVGFFRAVASPEQFFCYKIIKSLFDYYSYLLYDVIPLFETKTLKGKSKVLFLVLSNK